MVGGLIGTDSIHAHTEHKIYANICTFSFTHLHYILVISTAIGIVGANVSFDMYIFLAKFFSVRDDITPTVDLHALLPVPIFHPLHDIVDIHVCTS